MPTYEYVCDSCDNRFEIMQRMKDDPVRNCPKCGKAVRRVLSGGIGISFRGSGFYVNDSGGASSPGTAKEKDAAPPCACTAGSGEKPPCAGKSGVTGITGVTGATGNGS